MGNMDTTVYLIGSTKKVNEYGYVVNETVTKTEVFATLKSVKQSEFYNAVTAGVQADLIVKLRYADYENQKQVEIDSVVYRVLRTYRVNADYIELTLTAKDGD